MMTIGKYCGVCVLIAALSIASMVTVAQHREQSEIAADLRLHVGGTSHHVADIETRRLTAGTALASDARNLADLLQEVSSIPAPEREEELREALIDTLAWSHQRTTVPLGDHETRFFLLDAVVQLEDRSAIPVIARAMGSGLMATRALVAFGPEAADHVLEIVESLEFADDGILPGGLLTLRMMVEKAGSGGEYGEWFTGRKSRIHSVAAHFLDPAASNSFPSVVRAIDLAGALGDDDLRGMLAALEEGASLDGFSEYEKGRIRERAGERLRGVPPLPRQ